MDKLTTQIPGPDGKWNSYISKYPADAKKIPLAAMTKDSRNIVTSKSGQLETLLGGLIWNPNSQLAHPAIDQYEMIFTDLSRVLMFNDAGTLKGSSGNNIFSSIQAGFNPVANFEFATYHGRTYGSNGVDDPQVIDNTIVYGGVTYAFTLAKTKVMGCQIPGTQITAARVTDATVNQVPVGSHTYKATFVYYNGEEESNGNALASAVCVNDAAHTSNALSAIPVGGYGVTARNIYRDNNDSNWLLLDTIANNTATTYTDILPIGSTPTPIPTDNGLPSTFDYVQLWLDRLFVASNSSNVLSWSAPGEPDVFPSANFIQCRQDDIVTALYVFNGLLYVFGLHSVGVILGTTDDTFFYSPISSTVGCVDNRSIQVRTLVSTPSMIWLSALPNKGFYATNGYTVDYISDAIEDLAFNISQVTFLKRKNTQNTFAAFSGGTSTPGIDLSTNPGVIQTLNPNAAFKTASDWTTGVLSNLVKVGDTLKLPVAFQPALADGTLGGDVGISGSNLVLPVTSTETGEDHTDTGLSGPGISNGQSIFQPLTFDRAGTITSLSALVNFQAGSPLYRFEVRQDSFGVPGATIYTGPNHSGGGLATLISDSTAISLAAGKYWIGYTGFVVGPVSLGTWMNDESSTRASGHVVTGSGSSWVPTSLHTILALGYGFTQTPIADAGNWVSPVYDSGSTSITSGMNLIIAGAYPSGCSATVLVQSSDNGITFTTTDTLSSPNGTISLTGGNHRFWRVVVTLVTTDNTATPTIGTPVLKFNFTGTWTSPAIFTSGDTPAFHSLTAVDDIPAGTTITLQIATSHDNITYTAFTALGSATPDIWAKLKITFDSTGSSGVSTPTMDELDFSWNLTSTFTSEIIDTGANPPFGWEIFQATILNNAGISFFFRSASTSGGIPGASFQAIANGVIPTNTPLEFCQWKIVMSSTPSSLSQVSSVTVNWLIGSGSLARCASAFFDKSYYLSCATSDSSTNNLLIEFDYEGNWRIHNAPKMGTLGTFFNELYYASSVDNNVFKAFQQNKEGAANIIFDFRGKAFDYNDKLRLKVVRSLMIRAVNTGTTIHAYYSVDGGTTFIEMLNSSGTLGYATTADGSEFVEYFIPNFDGSVKLSGVTIMFRLVSNDGFPCKILELQPTVYKRKGKAIREAMA